MKITDRTPMMAQQEIDYIDKLLLNRRPKLCLEWGSGNSTLYFPRHKFIELWLSVEDNGHYLDYINGSNCSSNVQTLWILPGSSYADVVQRTNRKFDFILIDGLDREKCLDNAKKIINPGGVILLHDAGRAEYRDMIDRYGGDIIFQGEVPDGKNGYAHRGLAIFEEPAVDMK